MTDERIEAILKLIRDGAGDDYARRELHKILGPRELHKILEPPEEQQATEQQLPLHPIKDFSTSATYDPEYDRKKTDIALRIYQGWDGEPKFYIAHQGFVTGYPNYCRMYPDNPLKAFWELTKAAVRLFKWILMMSWDEARAIDMFRSHYMFRLQEIKELKTLPLGRVKEQ